MIIQHNLPAINAHRQNAINNTAASGNLEKLASGFRVNRASDDAAGLAISEKMRGQIRGLNMASQNSDNAVSLIKTAEGGLNEIHSILHRMRELGVQAANGTYQDDDRAQITKEVQLLKNEVDRISASTNYNGIKLLDGSLGGSKVTDLKGVLTAPGSFLDGSEGALAKALSAFGFIMDINDTANPLTAEGNVQLKSFSDLGSIGDISLIFTAKEDIPGGSSIPRITLFVGDKTYSAIRVGTGGATYVDAHGNSQILGDKTFAIVDENNVLVASLSNLDSTSSAVLPTDAPQVSGVITGISMPVYGETIKAISDTSTTGNKLIAPPSAFANAVVGTEKDKLMFQIGANGHADQIVGVGVPNMGCGNLGTKISTLYNRTGTLAGISVMSFEHANDALLVIDEAVHQVSAARANLGSMQNRLEHSIANLNVTSENLTAAESTIRDVDMAKEMMFFTKNNILSQASQAMLSQASQLPQGILSMLR